MNCIVSAEKHKSHTQVLQKNGHISVKFVTMEYDESIYHSMFVCVIY